MATMTCVSCDYGKPLKGKRITMAYDVGGLPNVRLKGILQFRCPQCGETYTSFGDTEALHAKIVKKLVDKPARLNGKEICFIRKYLGFSGRYFALRLEVSPEHLSKIENGKNPVSSLFDKVVRYFAMTHKPNRDYEEQDNFIAKKEKAARAMALTFSLKGDQWVESVA